MMHSELKSLVSMLENRGQISNVSIAYNPDDETRAAVIRANFSFGSGIEAPMVVELDSMQLERALGQARLHDRFNLP